MQRRSFIKKAALGAAAGGAAFAAPAIAQENPTIQWNLASSFPRSATAIYNGGENVAKYISEATGGKFKIRVYPAGELVPALGVLDGVENGTVECGHTASYYYYGKNPALCFDGAVPFGMNARQINAWMRAGDGMTLMRKLYSKYNIVNFPCGNTGAQMGGWFRKEVKTVEDLKGLKFRASAFAGAVLMKLGVVPQQIAGGDIYPSLEKGTIDAAEWIGPYDDEKLGFHRVAPYYYFPGWWEGSLQVSLYVNKDKYEGLPQNYKDIIAQASATATETMLATFDAENPNALKRLIGEGAKLRMFSKPVMDACYKAAEETYAELSAKDPEFKEIYENYMKFLEMEVPWFRIAEGSFDQFMSSVIK